MQIKSIIRSVHRVLTRGDTDSGAAGVRTLLALAVFIYLLIRKDHLNEYSGSNSYIFYLSIAYLMYSVLLWGSTIIWPGELSLRRGISILADTMVVTYAMIAGGEPTSAFYGGYLWVTIANGLRYGRKYLYLTNLASVLGFSLVLWYTPFWHSQLTLGLGLMLWLILLPGYVSALLIRLEAALHKANFANKAKTNFLSNMSHELRTPLNVIISYTDLLEEDAVENGNRQLADDAGKIQQSANHLLSLINGILELSRIESEKVHYNSEQFDIRLLFENIQAGMQSQLDQRGNRITIRYNLDHCQVYTDQLKLKQVMNHILDNANKFTFNGDIQVDVFSAGSYINPMLTIQVRDNGIGIPSSKLSNVFEPFTQVDSTITRKYEGVGLGLTIARRFIDILDGTIHIRSVEHEGTVVTVSIPQHPVMYAGETGSCNEDDSLHQAAG